jgi:hypothetical protein
VLLRLGLVVADDSGVVFVPLARAENVLARAEAIAAREADISADIRRGVPIDQAMHDARLAGRESTLASHVAARNQEDAR